MLRSTLSLSGSERATRGSVSFRQESPVFRHGEVQSLYKLTTYKLSNEEPKRIFCHDGLFLSRPPGCGTLADGLPKDQVNRWWGSNHIDFSNSSIVGHIRCSFDY